MTDTTEHRTILSLADIAVGVRRTLMENYPAPLWIKAEMNKLNHYPQSGHCYPELIEKSGDRIIAEMKATIWREDFRRINQRFQDVLHEPLKNGIKILLFARITFSPLYGLSLAIVDIDPSWSLGELEKEKQATLARLRAEEIFDRNRSLSLPLLPRRIAVISVETSKGFADFRTIIEGNTWGYSIFYLLFPAILQGDNAVPSIIEQLDRIQQVLHHFDAVAIIRGGGGDVGLTCYNHYELAKAVALFPIPVITGIGHSTNETVTEMVAFKNAITPTELAEFLLQRYHDFAAPLNQAISTLASATESILKEGKNGVKTITRHLKLVTVAGLAGAETGLNRDRLVLGSAVARFHRSMKELIDSSGKVLRSLVTGRIQVQQKDLGMIERSVELLDPVRVMNRGYSITSSRGRIIRSAGEVLPGDPLETILADGSVVSNVESIDLNREEI
ncbi:MAG TPA: exodeoxyribonuclease VII large subunit [Bacteroidales bacterium]|nr:exodeoxyribonuclease VII large subunit [Bacteroidales bacterium]